MRDSHLEDLLNDLVGYNLFCSGGFEPCPERGTQIQRFTCQLDALQTSSNCLMLLTMLATSASRPSIHA